MNGVIGSTSVVYGLKYKCVIHGVKIVFLVVLK